MRKFMTRAVIVAALLLLGLILLGLFLWVATEPGWHCAGFATPCADCASEREKEDAEDVE